VQNRSLCEELLSAKTLQLSFKSLAELAELSSLQNRELLGIVPMSFFDQTSTSPRWESLNQNHLRARQSLVYVSSGNRAVQSAQPASSRATPGTRRI